MDAIFHSQLRKQKYTENLIWCFWLRLWLWSMQEKWRLTWLSRVQHRGGPRRQTPAKHQKVKTRQNNKLMADWKIFYYIQRFKWFLLFWQKFVENGKLVDVQKLENQILEQTAISFSLLWGPCTCISLYISAYMHICASWPWSQCRIQNKEKLWILNWPI